MSAEPELQIVIVPDPADVVFDDTGTPMLTFEEAHSPHGEGWVLHVQDDDLGVDSYFLGGNLEDLDWAEDAARSKVTMLEDGRDAY